MDLVVTRNTADVDRTDLVVCRTHRATGVRTLMVVVGTPGGGVPTYMTDPLFDDELLAAVKVPARTAGGVWDTPADQGGS